MIEFWPFWVGGAALAAVALFHWILVGRLMAVSGRVSALIDAVRWGVPEPTPEIDEAALIAAMQAATMAEFGDAAAALLAPDGEDAPAEPEAPAAPEAPAEPEPEVEVAPLAVSASRQPLWMHVLFFASLATGGLVSAALGGFLRPELALRGERFTAAFGDGGLQLAVLALGGAMIGFGTRMAGGCTSGHGLCGVSRAQPGSLAATASFFGAGIGLSLLLRALS